MNSDVLGIDPQNARRSKQRPARRRSVLSLRCPCWRGDLHTHIYQIAVVMEPDVLHRLRLDLPSRGVVGQHRVADRQAANRV
jgi:hypothetical protein